MDNQEPQNTEKLVQVKHIHIKSTTTEQNKNKAGTIWYKNNLGLNAGIPVFIAYENTKAQTSLCICAVWSVPLFSAHCKV